MIQITTYKLIETISSKADGITIADSRVFQRTAHRIMEDYVCNLQGFTAILILAKDGVCKVLCYHHVACRMMIRIFFSITEFNKRNHILLRQIWEIERIHK